MGRNVALKWDRVEGRVLAAAYHSSRQPRVGLLGRSYRGWQAPVPARGKLFSEFLKDLRFWSVCTVEAMILKTKTATLGAPGRPRSELNLRKVLCLNDTQRGQRLTASNAATGLRPWLQPCAHDFSHG